MVTRATNILVWWLVDKITQKGRFAQKYNNYNW